MSWTTVKTNKGIALDQKLVVSGGRLTLVEAGAGTQVHSSGDLKEVTSLSSPTENAVGLGAIQRKTATRITVPVTISSNGVETSYTAKQIGIFATDPDDGKILYAISEDSTGVVIPTEEESVGFSAVWNFEITTTNSSTVSVEASGFITAETAEETYSPLDHGHSYEDLDNKPIVVENSPGSVTTADWQETTGEYPYYADIPVGGATSSHIASVVFDGADADSGVFASYCDTGTGYVRIYSRVNTRGVTPSTIICTRE